MIKLQMLSQALAGLLALAPLSAGAHEDRDGQHAEHDHDRARHARARGEILPIAEILRRVSAEVPGEVIEVELEHEDGDEDAAEPWVYELEILDPDGRRIEVRVDARHGRLLTREDD